MRRIQPVEILLAVAAAAYCATLPNHLGEADESQLLYESLRLLRGEVFFRDVFNNIPPGAHALFVAVFALVGPSLTAARLVMAAVHGAIVLAMLLACRALGVRPLLAAAAGLAHLALDHPAWPYASPHWLSTLLTLTLLLVALARPWRRQPRGAACLGVLVGVIALVQQQKAAVLAPTVGVLLCVEALLDRCYGAPHAWAAAARRAAWAAAGGLAIAVPGFAALAWWAGWEAFVYALVRFPLVNYRNAVSARWGEVNFLTPNLAAYTWPRLLAWLPAALPLAAGRALAAAARRCDEGGARRRAALAVVGAGACASVLNFPDFIHVAIVAPLLWIAVADGLELSLAAAARAGRLAAGLATSATALLVVASGAQLWSGWQRAWSEFPVVAQTPIGRVHLRSDTVAALAADLARQAAADPARTALVYPAFPALYLLAGVHNPTPYQLLLPGYSGEEQMAVARAAIVAGRVPLMVVITPWVRPDDPMLRLLHERYAPIGTYPGGVTLYRLRTAAAP